jgi:murein DD-endopeptidase
MYPHLSRILVSRGEAVGTGTTVGLAGASGRSSGPHVHWELRIRGAARDPLLAR